MQHRPATARQPDQEAGAVGRAGLRRRPFIPGLVGGMVLLNLLVVLLAALSLSQSRRLYDERAAVETQNLARLLEHDIVALLAAVDRILQTTAVEVRRQYASGRVDAAALSAYLERQRYLLPDVDGLRLTDAQGVLRYGTGLHGGAGPSVADRDYFRQLQAAPTAGLVVSGPLQGRVSGLWTLALARAVTAHDGRFAGVVVAAVALPRFVRAFVGLDVGQGASLTLFDREMRILVRYQDGRIAPELSGRRFGSEPLLRLMREGAERGTYRAVGTVDGVERVFTFVRLPHGLHISVGRADADYLALWRTEARKTVVMVVLFALITLVLTWFVVRGWRRQQAGVQALREAYDRLEAEKQLNQTIVNSSPFAIYTRDRHGIVTGWNPAAERLFGWTAQEVLGRPLLSVPSERQRETDELSERVLAGETIVGLEVQRQKSDGTLFDLSTTLAPLRDATGAVTGYLAITSDVTARKAAERRIEFLAYRDMLTGLPNRVLLRDRFEQALAHAHRAHTRVALLFLDLDNFKTINDTLGHAVGDALLKEIAARLHHCVRETDTISRQGGDEFLIVLPDLRGTEVITPVLIKIRESLQAPIRFDGHELSTSVSIGVAIYPDDGLDFETLLRKADTAMYRAKDAGRNHYRFFDEQMNTEALELMQLKNGLRRAIAQQEFTLLFQPQIDLESGRVVAAEALLRWQQPELGAVPPARFIPVAEESGLIVSIGEWVMHEACQQAAVWRQAGLPPLVVAVNLSAVQFRRGDVVQLVTQALQDSGLPADHLELELTESILLKDTEQVLASVRQLKALGVRLSIDDFGTGYSSLSYLKRFDVDRLKIDRSFVRDLAHDPDDAAIVRAIIRMARSLGLRTVAEGVEDAVTLARLRRFRCDEAQGYHFAAPMAAAELAAFVRQHGAADDGGRR